MCRNPIRITEKIQRGSVCKFLGYFFLVVSPELLGRANRNKI